jgi:5-methylcytosine-specific restriction endonuclease McrA
MAVIRTPEGKTCSKCLELKFYASYSKCSFVKDGHKSVCKECTKKYRDANKEMIKSGQKKHYEANKEKILAKSRTYFQVNRERENERRKEYYQLNKEREIETRKKYYQVHKEKLNNQHKDYYEANKENINDYKKEYYQANKVRLNRLSKAYGKKWRQTEQGRESAYIRCVKRRSLKYKVDFTPYERKQLLDRDNWTCQNCEIKVHDDSKGNWNTPNKAHIDHIIPISKGGNSEHSNLKVLCRTCNLSKGDIVPYQGE